MIADSSGHCRDRCRHRGPNNNNNSSSSKHNRTKIALVLLLSSAALIRLLLVGWMIPPPPPPPFDYSVASPPSANNGTGGRTSSTTTSPAIVDDDDDDDAGASTTVGAGTESDDDGARRRPRGAKKKTRAIISSTVVGSSQSPIPTTTTTTTTTLPIYLLESSTNRTSTMAWDVLAAMWDRDTRYEDLLGAASAVPSLLPRLTSPSSSDDDDDYATKNATSSSSWSSSSSSTRRIVVLIHCGPKTGSTALRVACRVNLEKTCDGIESPSRRNLQPAGYMDGKVLYPLIRRCANTSHFCVKEMSMPMEVPTYRNDVLLFVHMFPFRTYDEWAYSAMKQQYDRGGSKACDRTERLLMRCEDNNMEIDFRKYGKVRLSEFKDDVLRRAEEGMDESHAFLLYHHLDLTDVLRRLSDVYGVPLLPKSNERYKGKRPEGNCDARLLEMFHDCFSSRLMKLK